MKSRRESNIKGLLFDKGSKAYGKVKALYILYPFLRLSWPDYPDASFLSGMIYDDRKSMNSTYNFKSLNFKTEEIIP
jgi:hypothetical protein